MLNRETGVKPVLSRSCNAELVLKCHWETGKARRAMKQSQKNCLNFDAIKFLRLMGLRNYLTPFCIYMQKSVLFCFNGKSF